MTFAYVMNKMAPGGGTIAAKTIGAGVDRMTSFFTVGAYRSLIVAALLVSTSAFGAEERPRPSRLKTAIVQMALSNTIASNRDRIVARISEAAALGARVVVFPEGALRGAGGDNQALVDESIAAIRRAAQERNVYVLFGGKTWAAQVNKVANWMYAVGPDGRDLPKPAMSRSIRLFQPTWLSAPEPAPNSSWPRGM